MIAMTVTYQMPADHASFERAHFADDAWTALRSIDTILREPIKPMEKVDAVRDVLADVLWRAE